MRCENRVTFVPDLRNSRKDLQRSNHRGFSSWGVEPQWVKGILGKKSKIKWRVAKTAPLLSLTSEIPVKTFRGQIIEVFLHGGLCPNGLKAFRAKTPKSNDALRKPHHFCPWPQKFQLRPFEVKSSRFLFMRGCAPMGWRHFGQKLQNQMTRCKNRATFVPDLRNSS